MRRLLFVALAVFVTACGAEESPEPTPDSGDPFPWLDVRDDAGGRDDGGAIDDVTGEDGGRDGSTDPDSTSPEIEQTYLALCASCHGSAGEGGSGPELAGTARSREYLIDAIEARMPPSDPSLCVGACAEAMADAILSWVEPTPEACEGVVAPGDRGLRLLTRRELGHAITDVLALDGDADCLTVEFRYTPSRAVASVLVSGSFNGWAGSEAAGAWPMARQPDGSYTLSRTLEPGRHTYKFVLDGSEWVADPSNPQGEGDGFGGQNSVLDLACQSAASALPTLLAEVAELGAETRPQHFHFETHVESGVVTASGFEQQLAIGEVAVGMLDSGRLSGLAGCSIDSGRACRASLVERVGRRAFRRPLTSDQVERYVAVGDGEANAVESARLSVRALLASPLFLYRTELGVEQSDGTYVLDGWELATALSFAITGSGPDDALLDAVAAGSLDTDAGLESEVRRLLTLPAARDTVATFAEQWLGTESIAAAVKSPSMFPGFDDEVRASMRTETRAFVPHVIFDSTGRFEELLTASYGFVDRRLAPIYEVAGVSSEAPVRTELTDGRRSGVLGQAAVLATYAHSDQSSPFRRGTFVRTRLLCQQFGTPPANAGGVPDVDPSATTRERFAQHSADPVCASCHVYIDDLGFGFEHFDAIGAWRETEGGHPVDARGNMNDIEGMGSGTDLFFDDLHTLGVALANSQTAQACFVREYYRFVHGAAEEPGDACALVSIGQRFAESGHDIVEMMVATFVDPSFRSRR